MNIANLATLAELNTPATSDQIRELQSQFGMELPKSYCDLLMLTNGFMLNSGLLIYSSDEAFERNQTFSVRLQLRDYIAIGDNSGGRIVLMPFGNGSICLSDIGFMHELNLQILAKSLSDWVALNCDLGI